MAAVHKPRLSGALCFCRVSLALLFLLCFVSVLSLHETEDLSSVAGVLDTVCLAAFCVELCVRAGVYSWWAGPDAVLRNPWVLFDVYLVVSHGVCTFATVRGEQSTVCLTSVVTSTS